jgi:hypothetical protein
MAKAKKRSKIFRKMGRTSGDQVRVYRGPAYSMGYNRGMPTGRNYMKTGASGARGDNFFKKHVTPFIKNHAIPFVKTHGFRSAGNSLKNIAKGKKNLKAIKKALKQEFEDLIKGKTRNYNSKKSIKGTSKKKRRSVKKRGKGKGGFKKILL